MNKCPICLSKMIKKTDESLIVKYKTSNGVKDILVKGLSYSICESCNEILYNPEELKLYETQLEKALEEERKKEGLLSAKEIKSIRKKYDLTQEQLEKLLDIGPKNVAKWETYRSNQSKNIDRILRIMDKDPCFFVKLLNQVDIGSFKNVYDKNLIYIQNYPALEFLMIIYPDIDYRNITAGLINRVNKIIKDIITENISQDCNSQLILKEAV